MLNKKLGLDIAGSLRLGLDGDLFSDEDLKSGLNGSNGNSSMQEKVLSISLLLKFQMANFKFIKFYFQFLMEFNII